MLLNKRVLVVGHVCHDMYPGEYELGGAASFCSLLFSKLGASVDALTSFGPDFIFKNAFAQKNFQLFVQESLNTTVFENIYSSQSRRQVLHARANPLRLKSVSEIRDDEYDIELYAPIARELGSLSALPKINGVRAVIMQGWLREFSENGNTSLKMIDPLMFDGVHIAFISNEETTTLPNLLDQLKSIVPIVVETLGEHGVAIYCVDEHRTFPAFKTETTDTTGAGDIFAAAFLSRYIIDKDILQSVAFAQAAASLSVEVKGLNAIPELDLIIKRRNDYLNIHYHLQ